MVLLNNEPATKAIFSYLTQLPMGLFILGFRPIASEEELLREYTVSEQAASLPYTLLGGIVFDEGMFFSL